MTTETSLDAVCVCGHERIDHENGYKCQEVSLIRNGAKALCGCDLFRPAAHDTQMTMSRQEIYDMRRAMNTYGGSFVKAISEAFAVADERNTQRLIEAFPDYVKQYSAMAQNDRNKTT